MQRTLYTIVVIADHQADRLLDLLRIQSIVILAQRHVEKPDNDTKVHTVAVLLCIEYIALQIVTTKNPQGHSPCEHLRRYKVSSFSRRRESRTSIRKRKC